VDEATIVKSIRFARSVTFYARTGDWLPFGCLGVSVVGLALAAARRTLRPVRV
jgi:apolipoprotein N-acyltransferase